MWMRWHVGGERSCVRGLLTMLDTPGFRDNKSWLDGACVVDTGGFWVGWFS